MYMFLLLFLVMHVIHMVLICIDFVFPVSAMDFSSVETLIRNNFAKWRLDIEFALGIRDLNLALREDEPPKPTEDSSDEQREK